MEKVLGLRLTKKNNVIITGEINFADQIEGEKVDFGCGELTGVENDAFLAKLSEKGECLWSYNFGGDGYQELGRSVAVDKDNNIFLAGLFDGNYLPFGNASKVLSDLPYRRHVFIGKFDQNGINLWSKTFGGGGEGVSDVSDIAVDDSGYMAIVGGFTRDFIDLGGGPLFNAFPGTTDIFVAKLDPQGNHYWSQRFGDIGEEIGSSIATRGNDTFVTGAGIGALIPTPLQCNNNNLNAPPQSHDVFLMKLNNKGDFVEGNQYGDENFQSGNSLAISPSTVSPKLDSIFVAGEFHGVLQFGFLPILSMPSPHWSGYIAKFKY